MADDNQQVDDQQQAADATVPEDVAERDESVAEQRPDPEDVYISEAHAAVLADVVGHPYQLPTLPELMYTNRKHDKSVVKQSIKDLLKEGLIEQVRFEDGAPHPRHPDRFIGITDFGRSVLLSRMPDGGEKKLQAVYARADKPEDILRFERAPRPPRAIGGGTES